MAMRMGKVRMELSKAGWALMPNPVTKVAEKMTLAELLYYVLMGEGTAA